MAKIAVEVERALARRREQGTPGRTMPRIIARGEGWTVADVVCTAGPRDRPFEEQHSHYSIAIVLAGSFQYRSPLGRGLMTPGSLLLGNRGQCYECGHAHAEGDRCVSFWYAPDYFERLTADAGIRGVGADFKVPRLPPLGPLSRLIARAGTGVTGSCGISWEELGVNLAVRTAKLAAGAASDLSGLPLNATAGHACEKPPCDWRLSRERCWILRSSAVSVTSPTSIGRSGLNSASLHVPTAESQRAGTPRPFA